MPTTYSTVIPVPEAVQKFFAALSALGSVRYQAADAYACIEVDGSDLYGLAARACAIEKEIAPLTLAGYKLPRPSVTNGVARFRAELTDDTQQFFERITEVAWAPGFNPADKDVVVVFETADLYELAETVGDLTRSLDDLYPYEVLVIDRPQPVDN